MNTRCSRFSESALIAASVKASQPLPWCEPAMRAFTVRVAFKRRAPCLAHDVRSPFCLGHGVSKIMVGREFLINILKRGWKRRTFIYCKTEAIGLLGAVIRVLS